MCSTCHNFPSKKCSTIFFAKLSTEGKNLLFLLAIVSIVCLPFCGGSDGQAVVAPRNQGSRWWWTNTDQLSSMARIMMGDDALLLSGKHEGDILLSSNARSDIDLGPHAGFAEEKNAIVDSSSLWPGGVIAYEFSNGYDVLPMERFLIRRAMNDIEAKSCVRFVPRKNHKDYVKIIFDTYKCYSNIGRKGGEQVLSLGFFCVMYFDRGNVYHELLHVLGFYHEHTRPDRDEFVDVMWGNIREEAVKNFRKRQYGTVDNLQLPYDIDSVMHYSPHAFSKFSYMLPTIVSHDRGIFFTRSRWPSKIDYAKLNKLYRCHNRRNTHRFPSRNRI